MKRWLWLLLVPILGGAIYWLWRDDAPPPGWRTQVVERRDNRSVVTATGNLEAVTTVEVGTQVTGSIAELLVDYNSQVKAGDVLARIDTATLESDAASSRAALSKAQAERSYAALELDRVQRLHARQAMTDQELASAKVAFDVADASAAQARVAAERARRNLAYATITAPISGTVLRRDVDVGQTVNAGFSAPTLFVIAEDLSHMQIVAAVDEADIGKVHAGQAVEFTVQAWPDQPFSGTVRQVRMQSATTDNVVTYGVVVDVANPDGKLLPGMTATVSFIVEEVKGVLCAPNAALRFSPEGSGRGSKQGKGGKLWVADAAGALSAIEVSLGLRGEVCTEVSSEGLTEGMEVVVGATTTGSSGSSTPFSSSSSSTRRPGGF